MKANPRPCENCGEIVSWWETSHTQKTQRTYKGSSLGSLNGDLLSSSGSGDVLDGGGGHLFESIVENLLREKSSSPCTASKWRGALNLINQNPPTQNRKFGVFWYNVSILPTLYSSQTFSPSRRLFRLGVLPFASPSNTILPGAATRQPTNDDVSSSRRRSFTRTLTPARSLPLVLDVWMPSAVIPEGMVRILFD